MKKKFLPPFITVVAISTPYESRSPQKIECLTPEPIFPEKMALDKVVAHDSIDNFIWFFSKFECGNCLKILTLAKK